MVVCCLSYIFWRNEFSERARALDGQHYLNVCLYSYSSRRLVGLFAYLYVCVCVGMTAVA